MSITKSIQTGPTPTILLGRVDGDLNIQGWSQQQISVRIGDADDLQISSADDAVEIVCNDDCTLRVPEGATLGLHGVKGDTRIINLRGELAIERVDGDLQLRGIGQAAVGQVNGDLSVRDVRHDLTVNNISGDASISLVGGDVTLGNVTDDLSLASVTGSLEARVGDDASLRLNPAPGKRYAVTAGGDLNCRIPANASAEVSLSCGGDMAVRKFATIVDGSQAQNFTLGAGEAQLALVTVGDLALIGQNEDWQADGNAGTEIAVEVAVQTAQLAEQVTSQIETQMTSLTRQLDDKFSSLDGEEIGIQVQEKVQKALALAEQKLSAALQKVETRAKQANQEAAASASRRRTYSNTWQYPPAKSAKSTKPKADGPSEEERLTILRMVSEGKISVEQAEQLLAALNK